MAGLKIVVIISVVLAVLQVICGVFAGSFTKTGELEKMAKLEYPIGKWQFFGDANNTTLESARPPVPKFPAKQGKFFQFLIWPLLGAAANLAAELLQYYTPSRQDHIVSVTSLCGSSHQLIVRCASADDVIGPVWLNDQDSASFKFKQNVFGTTHFWCDVWWNGKWTAFPAFGEGAPKHTLNDFRVYGNFGNGYGVAIKTPTEYYWFKPWA